MSRGLEKASQSLLGLFGDFATSCMLSFCRGSCAMLSWELVTVNKTASPLLGIYSLGGEVGIIVSWMKAANCRVSKEHKKALVCRVRVRVESRCPLS